MENLEKFNFDEQVTKMGDVPNLLSVTNKELAKEYEKEISQGEPIVFGIAETRNPEQVQIWVIQLRKDWKETSKSLLSTVQGWDNKLVRANITIPKNVAIANNVLINEKFVINGISTEIIVEETIKQKVSLDESGEIIWEQSALQAGKEKNSPTVTSEGKPVYQNYIIDFVGQRLDVILPHDAPTENNTVAASKRITNNATQTHLASI